MKDKYGVNINTALVYNNGKYEVGLNFDNTDGVNFSKSFDGENLEDVLAELQNAVSESLIEQEEDEEDIYSLDPGELIDKYETEIASYVNQIDKYVDEIHELTDKVCSFEQEVKDLMEENHRLRGELLKYTSEPKDDKEDAGKKEYIAEDLVNITDAELSDLIDAKVDAIESPIDRLKWISDTAQKLSKCKNMEDLVEMFNAHIA